MSAEPGEDQPPDPERRLVLSYAPAGRRAGLAAVLALDAALGAIVRATREPLVGQMRLVWWRDALLALDQAPPPAQPVLAAVAAQVLPHLASAAPLADWTEGWEALLQEPLDSAALQTYAAGRAGVFAVAAQMLGATEPAVTAAGEGWALADLATHVSRPAVAASARALATVRFDAAFAARWQHAARPLGVLALLARSDLAGVPPGSPRRIARVLRHRLTGR